MPSEFNSWKELWYITLSTTTTTTPPPPSQPSLADYVLQNYGNREFKAQRHFVGKDFARQMCPFFSRAENMHCLPKYMNANFIDLT